MSDYLKNNLTLGNILTLLMVACGLVAGWARMDLIAKQQAETIAENKLTSRNNALAIQHLQSEFNDKLSNKEILLRNEIDKRNEEFRLTFARTDSKLEVLSKELTEIKSSLRSMETSISWMAKERRPSAR